MSGTSAAGQIVRSACNDWYSSRLMCIFLSCLIHWRAASFDRTSVHTQDPPVRVSTIEETGFAKRMRNSECATHDASDFYLSPSPYFPLIGHTHLDDDSTNVQTGQRGRSIGTCTPPFLHTSLRCSRYHTHESTKETVVRVYRHAFDCRSGHP